METNLEIRNAIISNKVKKWQIAEKLGITDSNFSRLLRKELSLEQKEHIISIIEELKKGEWKNGWNKRKNSI